MLDSPILCFRSAPLAVLPVSFFRTEKRHKVAVWTLGRFLMQFDNMTMPFVKLIV